MKYLLFVAVSLSATLSCKSSTPRPTTGAPTTGAAVPPASSGHHAVGVTAIEDENGAVFQIAQGAPGDPAVVGCSDGQREAFVDAGAFATIAGCIAEWDGNVSMRTAATGAACGDDKGKCGAPADACAPGWRVCGGTGALADLTGRITAEQCEGAGGGRFVSAISHCKTQQGCEYEDPKSGNYQCFPEGWCSEPVCCGADCGDMGACPSGVWENKTHIPIGTDQGCGAVGSSRARGVLCCK